MTHRRKAVPFQRHPSGTQGAKFGHRNVQIVLQCNLDCRAMINPLVSMQYQVGNAVLLKVLPDKFRPVANGSLEIRAVFAMPMQPVSGAKINPENLMSLLFQALSSQFEKRRQRSLQKENSPIG
ncbi:hypothetical protein ABLO27_03850 [Roseibium sp. SCPC15]|uniref:hypothetical protein n=1 Tax=Roseibium sp. SCP15 TaxID=3141376 RepID=UPI00333A7FC3